MTVTSVHKNPEARTMIITAEFDASLDRVWRLWADPRQLERWWGPPTHPFTVVEHDLSPGGTVSYFVTGPEGEHMRGWWHVLVIDPPHRIEFDLGGPDMPTVQVRISVQPRTNGGALMTLETRFPSDDAMEQLLLMGFEEGMSSAVGQIDGVVRAGPNPR